jgi:hypothetical protein
MTTLIKPWAGLRGWWYRLVMWNPSDAQLDRVTNWILVAAPAADFILKTVVVCAALFFAFEIGAGLLLHFGLAVR